MLVACRGARRSRPRHQPRASPEAADLLVERAKQILRWPDRTAIPSTAAHGFVPANFLGYLGSTGTADAASGSHGDPATLHFWYRGSPTSWCRPAIRIASRRTIRR
jgi:hypothetical protein